MSNEYSWKELEIKFSELAEKMGDCRIDFQWGSVPNSWHIAMCNNSAFREMFYTLSSIAGHKFISSISEEQLNKYEELREEKDLTNIWVKALKLFSGNLQTDILGEQKDSDGKTLGFVYKGKIYDPALVSSQTCMKFSITLNDKGNNIEESKTISEHLIFIGHGRSKLWARLKIYLEEELKLKTIYYESESRVGDSIVPILEDMLKKSSFAILILTAEDETKDGKVRARQNVIHEVGLFQGKLGFKKAIVLRQDGLEDLTNLAGVQYIGFTNDNIEQTFYELGRVLKREMII